MTTPQLTKDQKLSALIECGKLFYERRWMYGTAGNLSVKLNHNPLEFMITPSGYSKGSLKKEDLLVVKPGSKTPLKKGETPRAPSAETVIHQAIHETLPGCGAVFHVHPIHTTLISQMHGHPKQRQMLQFEWFEMMKGVGVAEGEIAELAIFPNWQDVSLVAKEIQQYLRDTPKALPVVMIYNHGVTAWGHTPEQAKNHLEIVDFVCEYLYLKRLAKN